MRSGKHNASKVTEARWDSFSAVYRPKPQKIRFPWRKIVYPRKNYHSYKAQSYSTSKYGQTHLTTNKQKKKTGCWLNSKDKKWRKKAITKLYAKYTELCACCCWSTLQSTLCAICFAAGGWTKGQRHRSLLTYIFLSLELSFLTYIFNSFCCTNVVISDRATYESKSEKSQWEVCHKLVIHGVSRH